LFLLTILTHFFEQTLKGITADIDLSRTAVYVNILMKACLQNILIVA